ncbi:hypothetical protein DPMN_181674 [Dreissena polymorpha]|uniref:Cadherin domain-containing protein n=1 Tax=Dreissena polymorpha TaxID=45954 RepID=A0A9D4I1V9_DREPO|nr:hypothetical protein DPMN_181674 [Dreissena polymorpha]
MAPDGRTERRTERRTDKTKTISLRLWRGITRLRESTGSLCNEGLHLGPFDDVDSAIVVADGITGYVVLDEFDVTDPGAGSVTCSHSGDAGTFKLTRSRGDNVDDAENDTFACALKSISPNTTAFGFWKNAAERNINANTTSIGTHVYTVLTSDVDSPSVTYSMTSMPEVPELFEISPATGEIMTVVNLKYAVHNGYLLTITASDGKDNTTGYLKINLYNVNSVPVIRNLPAEIYVNENTQFDTVLYTVYTDDPRDVVYVYFVVDPVALKNKFYMHFNTSGIHQVAGTLFTDKGHFRLRRLSTKRAL